RSSGSRWTPVDVLMVPCDRRLAGSDAGPGTVILTMPLRRNTPEIRCAAADSWHRDPPAQMKEGIGQSSIRSGSAHRNRYYEPLHGVPAHWARPTVERRGHCSTEAR